MIRCKMVKGRPRRRPKKKTIDVPDLLNRLSRLAVANVGDAMGRISAVDSHIRPMWPGARIVARAYTVAHARR